MISQSLVKDLEHHLVETLKIQSLANELKLRVRENIVHWDRIPGLISKTIWQSGIEITRWCIDTFAQDKFIALQKAPVSPEFNLFQQFIIRHTLIEISNRVQQILTTEPTLYQRYTSRLWLTMQHIESLTSYDQDRIIANNLFLPYKIWITLLNIFAQYEEFSEILQNKKLNITSTLLWWVQMDISQWKNEKEIYFPDLPGTTKQKTECDNIEIEKWWMIQIYPQWWYKYSLEIPISSIEHYANMIIPEQSKQDIRTKIYKNIPCLAWKNRFWKWGNSSKKDIVPEWELLWQK